MGKIHSFVCIGMMSVSFMVVGNKDDKKPTIFPSCATTKALVVSRRATTKAPVLNLLGDSRGSGKSPRIQLEHGVPQTPTPKNEQARLTRQPSFFSLSEKQ